MCSTRPLVNQLPILFRGSVFVVISVCGVTICSIGLKMERENIRFPKNGSTK